MRGRAALTGRSLVWMRRLVGAGVLLAALVIAAAFVHTGLLRAGLLQDVARTIVRQWRSGRIEFSRPGAR